MTVQHWTIIATCSIKTNHPNIILAESRTSINSLPLKQDMRVKISTQTNKREEETAKWQFFAKSTKNYVQLRGKIFRKTLANNFRNKFKIIN